MKRIILFVFMAMLFTPAVHGGALYHEVADEPCNSLTGYEIYGKGIAIIAPEGKFYLASRLPYSVRIQKDWGSCKIPFEVETRLKFDSFGNTSSLNEFKFYYSHSGNKMIRVLFHLGGIDVNDENGYARRLPNSSEYTDSEWYTWRLQVKEANKLNIYRDNICLYSNINCGETPKGFPDYNGKVFFISGNTDIHIDWYKIAYEYEKKTLKKFYPGG
jgi:hypothetical protein